MRVHRLLTGVVAAGLALLVIEPLRLLMGAPFSLASVAVHWLFAIYSLFLAAWTRPFALDRGRWIWSWLAICILAIHGLLLVLSVFTQVTWLAWLGLAGLLALFININWVFASSRWRPLQWGISLALALLAGVVPVLIVQVRSNFADEEFFAAVAAAALGAIVFFLFLGAQFFRPDTPISRAPALSFDRKWLGLALVALILLGAYSSVWNYQHSFYSLNVPQSTRVSASAPYLCGKLDSNGDSIDAAQVFRRLLARVEANPNKGAPEYGMLALGTKQELWAQLFRQSILRESAEELYTGPANSIKSVQYDAALRAYYFGKTRTAFPALFSTEEDALIRRWFAAINRRALTVEWVDWLYALAFAQVQEGPYSNQENGAGLLAVLELNGLQDPALSSLNKSYLARNPGGWALRFRNTDDAIVYQPEWITNAYFQSLYTGEQSRTNVELAFEWLLVQALPNGATLGYNHPETLSLATSAYLGAHLLGDGRYIWLASRALDYVEAHGEYLSAQPGVEDSVDLVGQPPSQGSCLLYADSGLPNQKGPLAPDKIVFRNGWSDDSTYLLLNLRFTGWHRYKATNAVTLVYKGGPVAGEVLQGEPFAWLPEGRSLFRDKRVPRENLNGLLVERTGLDAVLYELTGIGGPWAQDPPFYADVENFLPGSDVDTSSTVIRDWHGWQHRRDIYFEHAGPVIIVDDATGPVGQSAQLVWHAIGQVQNGRVRLGSPTDPVDMFLLPVDSRMNPVQITPGSHAGSELQLSSSSSSGTIQMVTVFSSGEWLGAAPNIVQENGRATLVIVAGSKRLALPLFTEAPH